MQGGHGYGGYGGSPPQGYGYGGYGGSPPQGYGYGGYGYGGYGYDAGGYNSGAAAGGYYSNNGYPSSYEDPLAGQTMKAHESAAPLNELEFQPSETCPKNYVIFDQTCTKSRVMFHPSLANKFGGGTSEYDNYYGAPGTGGNAYDAAAAGKGMYNKDNRDYDADMSCSVRHKEDTDEIDALLCSDDGDEDDVVSTGRTPGYRDGSSPDSCSSSYGGGSKSRSECTGGGGRKKKERMKKMVRTLKGIIPGGNQMDTPAVLDEAVKYLKSLKVEVKKLGVRGGSDS